MAAKSWELSDEEKKEINEKNREIGAQFDPETGRRKGAAENPEDVEDTEKGERTREEPERNDDDEDIRW